MDKNLEEILGVLDKEVEDEEAAAAAAAAAEAAAHAAAQAAAAEAAARAAADQPIEISDTVLECVNHLFHGFAVHENVDSIRAILRHLHSGRLLAKIIENAPVSNANIQAASARLNAARGAGGPAERGGNNSVARFRSQQGSNTIHTYGSRRLTRNTTAPGIRFKQNISGFSESKYIPIFFDFITKRLLNASIDKLPTHGAGSKYLFKSYGTDKYLELQDTLTHISGGSYGKVYRGRTNFIYKEMHNTNRAMTETFCRSVFLEALINVILQNDPRYGAHVGRLIKILKHPNFNDIANPVQILYFILEPIEFTLTSYLERPIPAGISQEAYIYPIFYQLGAVLEHFGNQYGFFHGDLHRGNVMLTRDGKVKLIDFGFSCVRGYTRVAKEPCKSYDFLILLFNLFIRTDTIDYVSGFNLIKPVMNRILSDGFNGPNIFSILRILYVERFSWHLAYYKYIIRPEWGYTLGYIVQVRPVLNLVLPKGMHGMTLREWFEYRIAPRLNPANFKNFWLLPEQNANYELPDYTYPSPCGTGPMQLIEVLPHENGRSRGRNRNQTRRQTSAAQGSNRARSRSHPRSRN